MPDANDTGLTCMRCGSSAVIPDAEILDSNGSPIKVNVSRKPEASVFKGRVYSPTRIQVCGVCGHMEWFATDPEAVWEAYLDRDD